LLQRRVTSEPSDPGTGSCSLHPASRLRVSVASGVASSAERGPLVQTFPNDTVSITPSAAALAARYGELKMPVVTASWSRIQAVLPYTCVSHEDDFGRTLHGERLVWPFGIEFLDKVIETGLLPGPAHPPRKPLWTRRPGVPIGCRSPRKRGPYSQPNRTRGDRRFQRHS
jgi:hypothetical protein